MKRVEISPGRFVTVSTEMAERAARVFASGAFTAAQVRDAAALEPRHAGAVLVGGGARTPARQPSLDGVSD